MIRKIEQFSGSIVYVDTMSFYLLLREKGSPAEPFFRKIQAGHIQAYTSVLTFDELAYRLLLARVRDTYSVSPLDNLRQNEQKLIAEFCPEIEVTLTKLQSLSHLSFLDFAIADLTTMHRNMRKYHLRPRDALHLSAMQKVGCMNLVSQDRDFDHIVEIDRYALA